MYSSRSGATPLSMHPFNQKHQKIQGERVPENTMEGKTHDTRARVHVGSPRPGGLLRHPALDWSGHGARLGSRVGCVGRHDHMTQRQPRTCEWTCAVARSTAVAVRAAWRRRSMTPVVASDWRRGALGFFSCPPKVSHVWIITPRRRMQIRCV